MMTTRGYNFGAGPAMLPESILIEAQEELLNWQELGMSVMEIGHRTPEFTAFMQELEQTFRLVLQIPGNYQVLFLGGAARTQFSMIPMNLLAAGEKAAYLITGIWSKMAFVEACKLRQAYCVASGEADGFIGIPAVDSWQLNDETNYFYLTSNETINGVRLATVPNVGLPLVADMTSCLLSEPINISDYGLIFAGAQKNIANAGLTVVIIREDLLTMNHDEALPTMLDYRTHSAAHSLYATPPTFNCYLALKMAKWVQAQGGVAALYKVNCMKAAKLYDYIDTSSFYHCKVSKDARSLMNVCFFLREAKFEELFLSQARSQGLYALKGHRMVGGLRASLYNAMPLAGVDCLLDFMQQFAKAHG